MSDNKKLPDSDVTNETIIEDLTKDLHSTLINADNTEPSSSSSRSLDEEEDNINHDENSSAHPDFVINSDEKTNKPDTNKKAKDPDDFDSQDDDQHSIESEEDDTDEVALKDMEVTLTDAEKEEKRIKAEKHKIEGNDRFKLGDYEESISCYTEGLKICPLAFPKDRAMIYSNRAAAKMKLDKHKEAINDCSKAIEYDPTYIKALYRRAQCYELTEKLDESLADFNKILEFDSQHQEARRALLRLPPLIEERNEKLKTEMIGKLKDLGNLFLKPFGLSTENFQMTQDPESKGYSINFKQGKS